MTRINTAHVVLWGQLAAIASMALSICGLVVGTYLVFQLTWGTEDSEMVAFGVPSLLLLAGLGASAIGVRLVPREARARTLVTGALGMAILAMVLLLLFTGWLFLALTQDG